MIRRASGVLPAVVKSCVLALLLTAGCANELQLSRLVLDGRSRELRQRGASEPKASPEHAKILLLALDGVDRDLLYGLLRSGELPGFAELLGERSSGAPSFEHVHFDDSLLATLPSSTMAAWATVLTGVPPAQHGMSGNEFFIRERRVFGAPAPVTFSEAAPTLACYTSDEYANKLLLVPTVYERMRRQDPNVLIWVAMHQIYTGADLLLTTKRTAVARAFEGVVAGAVEELTEGTESRDLYATLDRGVIEVVLEQLEESAPVVPDVLTVYLSGADLYGHIAFEGPDAARKSYLQQVLDPELGKLAMELRKRGALDDRWIVVTSDHGHTEVTKDKARALATNIDGGPPDVLESAGFRVRPFEREVSDDADFQSVLAYQGAMAFVYLADRSRCSNKGSRCDWTEPARFEEDVLAAAQAFDRANADGTGAPRMKGSLDMILARRPLPHEATDEPFQVYDQGKLVPLNVYLAGVPHPTYVEMDKRLRDLAVGPLGERAGDLILLANNGNRETPPERFYFAVPYRSWHGSPSRKDSEVPLIVAHPGQTSAAISSRVGQILGETPRQQKVTDLLLQLRYGPLGR